MIRGFAPVAALVFLVGGCTGGTSGQLSPPPPIAPSQRLPAPASESQVLGPLPVRLPHLRNEDTSLVRAGKIARYMEERWPRVRVRESTNAPGTVVAYSIIARYDGSIRDPQAYEAHVHRLTGDMYQASVELLRLSVRFFPALQYASVWEDWLLKPFWSRNQILHMGSPSAYREFDDYQQLVSSAAIQPPLLRMDASQGNGGAEPSPRHPSP